MHIQRTIVWSYEHQYDIMHIFEYLMLLTFAKTIQTIYLNLSLDYDAFNERMQLLFGSKLPIALIKILG